MTPITLTELITQAGEKAGSLRKLAELMGKNQNRISEWRTGKAKPDAHEIAYLAETAGLPVLQTVAEIESQLDSRYAEVWRNALGKLTAAGVAASFVGALAFAPDDANSRNLHAVNDSYAQKPTVYIMSTEIQIDGGKERVAKTE